MPRPDLAAQTREPLADPGSRLRADPWNALEAIRFDGSQLLQRPHVERRAELAHSLRREPEQPADRDELGHHLRLELAQLRQLAGLDELAQACLDSRPDSSELAYPSRTHDRRDVGRRRPDQLGRPPVGAGRVEARAVELEQRGEGVEPLGKSGVVHPGIVSRD